MKKLLSIFIFVGAIAFANASIGGYNVYYGTLHNHTETPDYPHAQGQLENAYQEARAEGLDFYGVANHGYMHDARFFDQGRLTAHYENYPYSFTTFYGFEWTHGSDGHVAIFNTWDHCSSWSSSTNTFSELLTWLNTPGANRENSFAFFNHPERNPGANEFNRFENTPNNKFVGIALFNKGDGFERYFYNNGYDDYNSSNHYEEAIEKGWWIGASGSEDNHTATWGTTDDRVMAIMAHNNTRQDLIAAIKARRFYATEDRNIEMSFELYDEYGGDAKQMGSITNARSKVEPWIQATDGNNEYFSKLEIYKNGVVVWSRSFGYNRCRRISVGDFHIPTSVGDYLYIKVTQQDGDEAISSPICIGQVGLKSGNISDEKAYNTLAEEDFNFICYPNPVSTGEITLFSSNLQPNATMIIMDTRGKVLKSEIISCTEHRVSTADMNAGMYLVKVVNGSSIKVEKILVQ